MRSCLYFSVLALLAAGRPASADTFGTGANQFTIEFVPVLSGSVADQSGYGAVPENYRMGKYEVTRAMIDAYNAIALAEGRPEITMFDYAAAGISGGNRAERPATGVSWNEAARFVNWLNTSEGLPPAYKFTTDGGNDSIVLWEPTDGAAYDPENRYRNPEAGYFLPTEDEWYRAAYYDQWTESYRTFTTGSDSAPAPVSAGTDRDTAVFGQAASSGPADVADAGGLSPLGTMAQGGNVTEWMETGWSQTAETARILRGGWWDGPIDHLESHQRSAYTPHASEGNIGFRVAAHPFIGSTFGISHTFYNWIGELHEPGSIQVARTPTPSTASR